MTNQIITECTVQLYGFANVSGSWRDASLNIYNIYIYTRTNRSIEYTTPVVKRTRPKNLELLSLRF